MDWKERAEQIKHERPEREFGETQLHRQLADEGHAVSPRTVGRWLKKHYTTHTAENQELEHATIRENRRLKKDLQELKEQFARHSALKDVFGMAANADLDPPKWVSPKRTGREVAIATATLADTHFDEVVNPAEIEYLNAYNRDIAEMRLEKFFRSTVRLGRDYFSTVTMEGLVLAMLGDIVSGDIHEELERTNEASIIDTSLYWADRIAAGIEMLLEFYPQIYVPCVVGNHGRKTRKPRAKGRVHDNFDYLIYAMIAKHFRSVPEVTLNIPDSADVCYQVYDVRYRATHGDQFRGGSGIAGALSPLLLGESRKRQRSNIAKNPYDYLIMGHWHQDIDVGNIIVSNCIKGYDEYAYQGNFKFAPPRGAFWLTDPREGRTLRAHIHVQSEDETWKKAECECQPGWMT